MAVEGAVVSTGAAKNNQNRGPCIAQHGGVGTGTSHNLTRVTRWLLIAATAVAMAGCIVVPQTREVYDPECRVLTRQMTLETAYLGGFQRCAGDGCLALLSAAGAVTAASAVVSGSIALVGNVVYWFERQGQCLRVSAPTEPSSAAPAGPVASAPK